MMGVNRVSSGINLTVCNIWVVYLERVTNIKSFSSVVCIIYLAKTGKLKVLVPVHDASSQWATRHFLAE